MTTQAPEKIPEGILQTKEKDSTGTLLQKKKKLPQTAVK